MLVFVLYVRVNYNYCRLSLSQTVALQENIFISKIKIIIVFFAWITFPIKDIPGCPQWEVLSDLAHFRGYFFPQSVATISKHTQLCIFPDWVCGRSFIISWSVKAVQTKACLILVSGRKRVWKMGSSGLACSCVGCPDRGHAVHTGYDPSIGYTATHPIPLPNENVKWVWWSISKGFPMRFWICKAIHCVLFPYPCIFQGLPCREIERSTPM